MFESNFLTGIVIFIALLLLFKRNNTTIRKTRPKHGLLGYSIVYTDQKTQNKKENVSYGAILYCAKYDLKGKPDYIFKKFLSKQLVPIEIKSGEIGDSDMPRKGDMLQLAAYFLIIQEVYGVKPKFGRLVYKDHMFIIKNTMSLRRETIRMLSRMRMMLRDGEEEAYPSYLKCRNCVCNGTVCEYCQSKERKRKTV